MIRLPRTRGDGPNAGSKAIAVRPAPPHARGWTHDTMAVLFGPQGSPARAGIDPLSGAGLMIRFGLCELKPCSKLPDNDVALQAVENRRGDCRPGAPEQAPGLP